MFLYVPFEYCTKVKSEHSSQNQNGLPIRLICEHLQCDIVFLFSFLDA